MNASKRVKTRQNASKRVKTRQLLSQHVNCRVLTHPVSSKSVDIYQVSGLYDTLFLVVKKVILRTELEFSLIIIEKKFIQNLSPSLQYLQYG